MANRLKNKILRLLFMASMTAWAQSNVVHAADLNVISLTTNIGRGAEATVSPLDGSGTDAKNTNLMVCQINSPQTGQVQQLVYLKFDLADCTGYRVKTAEFSIYPLSTGGRRAFIDVYGLREARAERVQGEVGEDWSDGGPTSTQGLDRINWNNAPGLASRDPSSESRSVSDHDVVHLGTLSCDPGGGRASLSSDQLSKFLNGDTNGVVTLILVNHDRCEIPIEIAGRGNHLFHPPTLRIEQAPCAQWEQSRRLWEVSVLIDGHEMSLEQAIGAIELRASRDGWKNQLTECKKLVTLFEVPSDGHLNATPYDVARMFEVESRLRAGEINEGQWAKEIAAILNQRPSGSTELVNSLFYLLGWRQNADGLVATNWRPILDAGVSGEARSQLQAIIQGNDPSSILGTRNNRDLLTSLSATNAGSIDAKLLEDFATRSTDLGPGKSLEFSDYAQWQNARYSPNDQLDAASLMRIVCAEMDVAGKHEKLQQVLDQMPLVARIITPMHLAILSNEGGMLNGSQTMFSVASVKDVQSAQKLLMGLNVAAKLPVSYFDSDQQLELLNAPNRPIPRSYQQLGMSAMLECYEQGNYLAAANFALAMPGVESQVETFFVSKDASELIRDAKTNDDRKFLAGAFIAIAADQIGESEKGASFLQGLASYSTIGNRDWVIALTLLARHEIESGNCAAAKKLLHDASETLPKDVAVESLNSILIRIDQDQVEWKEQYSRISKSRQDAEKEPLPQKRISLMIDVAEQFERSGFSESAIGVYLSLLRQYPDSPEAIESLNRCRRIIESGTSTLAAERADKFKRYADRKYGSPKSSSAP